MAMTLKDGCSKAEEIQSIKEYCKQLPADSYLSMLLVGVSEYCEHEIENDSGCALTESIDYYRKQVSELKNSKELAVKDAEIDLLKGQLAARTHESELLRTAHDESWSDLQNMRTTLDSTRYDKARLEVQVATQTQEIIELKAKLYDLMVA